MDDMLAAGQFSVFITEMLRLRDDDDLWSLYLHKAINQSFAEFKESVLQPGGRVATRGEIEATINNTYKMLSEFDATQWEEVN